jgi:hypothetical protein
MTIAKNQSNWFMLNVSSTNNAVSGEPDARLSDDRASSQQYYTTIKEHLYSDLEGEAVILSLKNGKYYGINGVGACIWKAMENPANLREIQSAVMREYDVDKETCRREVLSFLEKMTAEELIEISDEKAV